tara:strand:- start:3648 stop:5276 length:1629 start_codon:yes stop_codon:yes gene_type:complete
MINLQSLLLRLWLCIPASLFSVFLSFSSQAQIDCSTDTVGLCTPTIEEIIDETITETIEYEADGYTVTTTTETTTTTTTVANEDSGDILDGDNGYVGSSQEGDMDIDWGGQGPASMPSGTGCGQLGTDKCASITGSGSSTSTMGVDGMGTTFINTVDISDLDIEYGGKTNYTIKVDKQDAEDRIYMHITGKNGNTSVFSGTDILSESGVASGFQEYAGGFDFSGKITTLIIEIGGRDINLAIGPLFDDVTVNVLYNTINTIVQESITSVEMWVAYGGSTETEVIDIVENIFEHNDIISAPDGDISIEPEFEEPDMEVSYEIVEIEMEMEIPTMEIEMPEMEMDMPEIEVASVETEIEMEMEMDMEMPEPEMKVEAEPTTEPEPEMKEPVNEPETEAEPEPADEPKEDVAEEPEPEESAPEADADEDQPEDMKEPEDKSEAEDKPVKKPESKKENAAKKIVKKMGDKGRYDSQNQLKTLIVMQVLGNTKTFFESQQQLNDRVGFFTDESLPDAVINDNNIAGYFLFAGSDGLMNEMVMQQWQK